MASEERVDVLAWMAARVVEPVIKAATTLTNQWYLPYMYFAVLSAFVILLAYRYDRSKSLGGNLASLWSAIFDRRVILHPSALLDYRFALINQLIYMFVVIYLVAAIGGLSALVYGWFSSISFLKGAGGDIGWLGVALMGFAYAFVYDTAKFFSHMMQHKVPILWEFHKVHHSAEILTPVTAIRVHPVGYLISATAVGLSFGALNGSMLAVFESDMARFSVLGMNAFAIIYFTVGLHHLKHSHIWFTYPRFIREVIASPSLHIIHHSNEPRHYDKNFGFVFTFWDRVMGTYCPPENERERDFDLGVSESEGHSDYQSVMGLYLTPFRRAWRFHIKPLFVRRRGTGQTESRDARTPSVGDLVE